MRTWRSRTVILINNSFTNWSCIYKQLVHLLTYSHADNYPTIDQSSENVHIKRNTVRKSTRNATLGVSKPHGSFTRKRDKYLPCRTVLSTQKTFTLWDSHLLRQLVDTLFFFLKSRVRGTIDHHHHPVWDLLDLFTENTRKNKGTPSSVVRNRTMGLRGVKR